VSGNGRLSVDLDGLEQFAKNLASIRTRMNAAQDWAHCHDGQMGSAEVEGALHDFADGWRDGRTKIDGNAKALADMAQGSVDTFRSADQQLADQLRAATGPGQGDPNAQ